MNRMKVTIFFMIGFFIIKSYSQQNEINKELNFTLKFVIENDTVVINKEHTIIVNGLFPKDNSGHQGGRVENIRKTDKNGNFELYIMKSGEFEFIVPGKGSVTKRIEKITDYEIFLKIEKE
jgi:hypothetical protein